MASDTTAESPWPLRVLVMKITAYLEKMPTVWVEGQLISLQTRGNTAYFEFRDTDSDISMPGSVPINTLRQLGLVTAGSRVVMRTKPSFWAARGQLRLAAQQMRLVGEGDLLARIEILKRTLAAEGLFDRDRKRALPFLPRRIGLITGRNAHAHRDVVENTRRRWPAAAFEVREVSVQGPQTVAEVCGALAELDRHPEVDVIVIARGGGSIEDLLPFSNETLIRAVAQARTPVVSAIGHEPDHPLLDEVADLAVSTPTAAAQRIVPDAREQLAYLQGGVDRLRTALARGIQQRGQVIATLASRPVLRDPIAILTPERLRVDGLTQRLTHSRAARLQSGLLTLERHVAQLRALSPQSTLDRGYAVVSHRDGRIVRAREDVAPEELLRITVAHGDFAARVVGAAPPATPHQPPNPDPSEEGDV